MIVILTIALSRFALLLTVFPGFEVIVVPEASPVHKLTALLSYWVIVIVEVVVTAGTLDLR